MAVRRGTSGRLHPGRPVVARFAGATLAMALLAPPPALAAAGVFSGASLGLLWVVPFAGMLLSIAVFPLLAPLFWHHHFGKVAAFWALAFLLPFAVQFGAGLALHQLVHTALLEYVPFIILLLALFTVAGGIH